MILYNNIVYNYQRKHILFITIVVAFVIVTFFCSDNRAGKIIIEIGFSDELFLITSNYKINLHNVLCIV